MAGSLISKRVGHVSAGGERPRRDMSAPAFVVLPAALLLCACAPSQPGVPEIHDIDQPSVTREASGTVTVRASARIDPKGWPHTSIYFTMAPEEDGVCDFEEANLAEIACEPGRAGELRCAALLEASPGTWRYQWHVDFGPSADDVATVSRPARTAEPIVVADIEETTTVVPGT